MACPKKDSVLSCFKGGKNYIDIAVAINLAWFILFLGAGFIPVSGFAKIIEVGPTRNCKVPSQASVLTKAGDVIEIDAGLYINDEAIWRSNHLTIRGVGGRVHLKNEHSPFNKKAIWVIQGNNTTVENIEFSNCSVADKNGAGIRQEGKDLIVRRCYFHDNENGILAGRGDSIILIEYCVFERNGFGDGYSHNLYIGNIKKLIFRFNCSQNAHIGHNLKSRAEENYILYNRIMDGNDGRASMAIDLPNGGLSYIIGNEIQQGPQAENSTIIMYAAEGASNPIQELYVVNNTLVNDMQTGIFINNKGNGSIKLVNNLFIGNGTILSGMGSRISNLRTPAGGVRSTKTFDYRLIEGSPAIDKGIDPGMVHGFSLFPTYQYIHPANGRKRDVHGPLDIGAFEN